MSSSYLRCLFAPIIGDKSMYYVILVHEITIIEHLHNKSNIITPNYSSI